MTDSPSDDRDAGGYDLTTDAAGGSRADDAVENSGDGMSVGPTIGYREGLPEGSGGSRPADGASVRVDEITDNNADIDKGSIRADNR